MSMRFGIHSSALCPGPFLVGEPNPRKSAIDCPIPLTPSTTQSQAFLMPSPMFCIRFLPQLNASLNSPEKKSPIFENSPVMVSHIHDAADFMPSHRFVKKPLIPSQALLNIATILSPRFPKKFLTPSQNPWINSHIPRKIFLMPSQRLDATFFICSQASDQSPRSTAQITCIISRIAWATSITA